MEKTKEELLAEIEQLKLENSNLVSRSEDLEILYMNLSDHNSTIENELNDKLIIIEESSKKIMDSVVYAKRIQNAMLSNIAGLKNIFPESFIFLKSRDIVSGDFYWFDNINNHFLIAAVDCTGHGVPGAFMSIMGIALLNEISRQDTLSTPCDILEVMRNQIKASFKQTTASYQAADGMDLAFCSIDLEKKKLQFAGANNPLIIIRNKEMLFYKGTRNPIGSYIKEIPFQNNEIELKQGDVLYLFSDGFRDQINTDRKKYTMRRFKLFLQEISNKSLAEQEIEIGNELEKWRDGYSQIDDILIIGLKIP